MDIEAIKLEIEAEAQNINSAQALEAFRVKYLGRKGILTQLTGTIPGLAPEQRGLFGQQVNGLKNRINAIIQEKQKIGAPAFSQSPGDTGTDIGLPGIAQESGRKHPITQVIDEICDIFIRMGFSVVEGPEVETEYNNFTGLNIPLEHPSRDTFDTFYLKPQSHPSTGLRAGNVTTSQGAEQGKLLLRSHTSPVQIRAMRANKPPLAVVVPGRVYRPDATDASHSFMFHQVEGFMVDKEIRFSDLKGVLEIFIKQLFSATRLGGGPDIKMRFRPHFFPFTEPSAEVDISCIICKGHQAAGSPGRPVKHCSVCGGKGWLEILGCGMIHPDVFRNVGYAPKKYSGFAFGMGVERIAMLKFGINDIRLFFENDLRFLKQF